MRVYLDLPDPPLARPSALAIGNFDGVHLGHQALLRALLAEAQRNGQQAGLLTFDPHPATVLRPQAAHQYLTTVAERLQVVETLGLDFAVVYPFSLATAQTPARQFVASLLRALRLASLWVGPDFALGRGRQGDIDALGLLGQELGFALRVVQPQALASGEVRSARIRNHLLAGEVAEATAMLGRPYRVAGLVVPGARRGRGLGFPTANLAVPEGRLLPANGVYATWVTLGGELPELASRAREANSNGPGQRLPSVTNVGVRPSFDNGQRTVEAHLLDFQGDLYGQEITLEFVARLRPEMRFASIDALRAQIARDAEDARRVLAVNGER